MKNLFICTCKHHIRISVTGMYPYPAFEKSSFATWRTPKANGILRHALVLSIIGPKLDFHNHLCHQKGPLELEFQVKKSEEP